MTTPTCGRHSRTEASRLTKREMDAVVRDLARILLLIHKSYRESLKKRDEPPRGFAQRIFTPSKTRAASLKEISVANIAEMVLIDDICREMCYDNDRRIFFCASIVRVLKQPTVSEEDIAQAISKFLRRYPRPLHMPAVKSPPEDN